jgi:hypothetical protein
MFHLEHLDFTGQHSSAWASLLEQQQAYPTASSDLLPDLLPGSPACLQTLGAVLWASCPRSAAGADAARSRASLVMTPPSPAT